MTLSLKAKEAIKTALAFTLAYGFALRTGWLNPMWVALTVAVVAMPSAGQSLQKGMLRLAGTIPGCVVPLVIFGFAAQDRWLSLALACAWVFFTTYMMLSRPATYYLWNVAGFTSLIIMMGGFESPAELFERSESRTVATVVGIIIYTLVTTFLWPRSNAGAIRKALAEVLSTQHARFTALRARSSDEAAEAELRKLHPREVQQLAALDVALHAEGSESHRVRELRPALTRLRTLTEAIMESLDRFETAAPRGGELRASFPTVDELLDEVDARFSNMAAAVSGEATPRSALRVSTSLDREAVRKLVPLDRAAVIMARDQIDSLESLTADAADLVEALASEGGATNVRRFSRGPVMQLAVGPDLDNLRGAAFVAANVFVGFLIWVYVNPPGHVGWIMLPGVVAMVVARAPQLNATIFIRPTAIALALGISIYVFVLPRLSTFYELGVVLFASMFAVNYFFDSIGKFAGMVGVLLGISVQQQQTYSFAAAANNYVYVLSAFLLVYLMSYLIQSPRPEKAVLYRLRRFFRSAYVLIESTSDSARLHGPGFLALRVAWHRQEVRKLPEEIERWSKAARFAVSKEQTEPVDAWVLGLRSIAHRVDELVESRLSAPDRPLAPELADDLHAWRSRLENVVERWERRPDQPAGELLREQLDDWRPKLEARLREVSDEDLGDGVDPDALTGLYRVLAGYRGLSEALMAYDERALRIDWAAWREERFT